MYPHFFTQGKRELNIRKNVQTNEDTVLYNDMHDIIFTYSRQNKAHMQYVCELARDGSGFSFFLCQEIGGPERHDNLDALNQGKRGIAMDMLQPGNGKDF